MESGEQAQHLMPPPTFDLVSRKRQRGDFDEDTRESKSLRQSPSPSVTVGNSPAPSADSVDSFDFDDPLLGQPIGRLFPRRREGAQGVPEVFGRAKETRAG